MPAKKPVEVVETGESGLTKLRRAEVMEAYVIAKKSIPPQPVRLAGVEIINGDFEGYNLQGLVVSGKLVNCSFRNCDLRWSDFSGAEQIDCDFEGANTVESVGVAL